MIRRLRRAIGLLLFTVLLSPGDSLLGQVAESAASRFVGTWRVASWEHRFSDGTVTQDPKTVAFIMYSEGGRMCYVSMDPNRPEWASTGSPTQAEAHSAILGMGAYCSRVEINSDEGFVLHHVEVERSPNNVGITRKRFYEFRGPDELVLTVDPVELRPGQTSMTLVWRRLSG
jgi:hypothetical protein